MQRSVVRWMVGGLIATATALALFDQLDYALSADQVVGHDALDHLTTALRTHHCGPHPARLLAWSLQSRGADYHHGPLSYVVSGLFLSTEILGPLASIYAAKVVWLLLLVPAVYGIGHRLGRSPWAGLAACTVAALSPIVLQVAREVSLEFQNLAATAGPIYLFLLSRSFSRRRTCVALGIACGLAVLIKTTPVVVLAPLFLVAYFFPPTEAHADRRGRERGLVVAAAAAFAVASWYYLPLVFRFLSPGYLRANFGSGDVAGQAIWIARSLRLFLFSPLQIALVWTALVLALWKRDWFILAPVAAAASLIAFTLALSDFHLAYLIPSLVLAAVFVGRGFLHLPPRAAPVVALALAALCFWPLFAPPKDPARFWNRPYGTALLYAQQDCGMRPLRLTADLCPTDGEATPWETVWRLSRLLANRYADASIREITLVGGGPSGALLPALVLARPGETSADRELLHRIPTYFGEPGQELPTLLPRKTLVVAFLPVDHEPVREEVRRNLERAIETLNRSHRLDLAISLPRGPGREAQHRALFFVRRADG